MARPIGRRKRIRRRRGVAIGLAGELDILCLPALRAALRASLGDTLGDALGSRRRVWVDLSRVTFVDSLCMTELVVQYLLHSGRLVLWRPSPEVRLTLAICELEDWVSFHPDPAAGKRDLPPEA